MKSCTRRDTLYQRKAKAYQWLYEFTQGQCGDCALSGCACKDSICAHVECEAFKRGIALPKGNHPLRFIGQKGCLVPPHLRETCTIYLCDRAQQRSDFDRERYRRLKSLCAAIDWTILCLEEKNAGTASPSLQKPRD